VIKRLFWRWLLIALLFWVGIILLITWLQT
jgi:hypothetical protein